MAPAGDYIVADQATAFAPGRVNLIGEHTDYNEGLALPFAISDGVTVRAQRTDDDRFQVIASDLGAHDTFALEGLSVVSGWRAFARGAVGELTAAGCELVGARLEIAGSVPRGSGLSSSAALEVALCLALLAVAEAPPPDRLEIARICSRVENEWVGAQTGLLDQIASLFGEPESAMRIDFRSLEVTPVALELDGYRLVTLDSGERHAHAGGSSGDGEEAGYNQRRAECRRAAEMLGVSSLREATLEQVDELPEPLRARARHVVTENGRVEETVQALSDGDLERVGELVNASHASLRDCFEISTPSVERTVTTLRDAGAIGARIMGGGFGGFVLGLLPPGAEPPPGAIEVAPGAGARLVR
ncbi:MAG TPA: galactokinase [Solirubrobacteraceae bacterium]|jgi:galactokinase